MEEVSKFVCVRTLDVIVNMQTLELQPERARVGDSNALVSKMGRLQHDGVIFFGELDGTDLGFVAQAEQGVAPGWHSILFLLVQHYDIVSRGSPEPIAYLGVAGVEAGAGIAQ